MANTHSIDLESTSSQYFRIADASQTGLDLTTSFTIEAWIKIESVPGDMRIVSKNGTSNGSYTLNYRSGKLDIFVDESNDYTSYDVYYASVASNFSTGTWYHIAVSWAGGATKQAIFYVNGSKIGDTIYGTNVETLNNNDADFQVGANDNGTNSFFDGKIDEVRIWNDVRSALEISDNYNKELVGDESNLVAYWKFNNSALDETSNNNDLTAVNSPTYSTDVPFTGASTIIHRLASLGVGS